MKLTVGSDLVDTEHCEGDVNKMLLGSFEEAYDEMEDDDVLTDPTSPSQSTYFFDQQQNTEPGHYSAPGALPRSQTMQSQHRSRGIYEVPGQDGRPPVTGMHRQFKSG